MKSRYFAVILSALISFACSATSPVWDPSYDELTKHEGCYSAQKIGIPPTELPEVVRRASEGDHDAIVRIQPIAPEGDGASALMDKMLLAKILKDAGDRAFSTALEQQTPDVIVAHSRIPGIEVCPLTSAVIKRAEQVGASDGDKPSI